MTHSSSFRNRFLRALPTYELAAIEPYLEPALIRPGEVLQEAGELIEDAYFLESGMVSLVAVLEDDDPFEVGTVGREGMVGAALVRSDRAILQSIGQVAGESLRISSDHFRDALQACPVFHERAAYYRDLMSAVAFQSAACMARHDINHRLARWLLCASDALESSEFKATQETMAGLLGVCRPTVSIAASMLQDAGIIQFTRGRIAIVDRTALERSACSCYGTLRRRYDTLRRAPVTMPRLTA